MLCLIITPQLVIAKDVTLTEKKSSDKNKSGFYNQY